MMIMGCFVKFCFLRISKHKEHKVLRADNNYNNSYYSSYCHAHAHTQPSMSEPNDLTNII